MKSIILIALMVLSSCSESGFTDNTVPQSSPTASNETTVEPIAEGKIQDTDASGTKGSVGAEGDDQYFDADGKLQKDVPLNDADDVRDLCRTGTTQTMTTPIHFPRREDCSFGKGQNLDILDGSIRAFEQTTQSIRRPGLVCDVKISSVQSDFHFDDFLFFTLNGNILASGSNSMVRTFDLQDNFFAWNWQKLLNFNMRNDDETPYCFAAEVCEIPAHDKKGEINLDFDEKAFASLALAILKERELEFQLIATGDNDPADCFHEQLDLIVELLYVP